MITPFALSHSILTLLYMFISEDILQFDSILEPEVTYSKCGQSKPQQCYMITKYSRLLGFVYL